MTALRAKSLLGVQPRVVITAGDTGAYIEDGVLTVSDRRIPLNGPIFTGVAWARAGAASKPAEAATAAPPTSFTKSRASRQKPPTSPAAWRTPACWRATAMICCVIHA